MQFETFPLYLCCVYQSTLFKEKDIYKVSSFFSLQGGYAAYRYAQPATATAATAAAAAAAAYSDGYVRKGMVFIFLENTSF